MSINSTHNTEHTNAITLFKLQNSQSGALSTVGEIDLRILTSCHHQPELWSHGVSADVSLHKITDSVDSSGLPITIITTDSGNQRENCRSYDITPKIKIHSQIHQFQIFLAKEILTIFMLCQPTHIHRIWYLHAHTYVVTGVTKVYKPTWTQHRQLTGIS